ncbi:MAG: exopolyphosphatase [bacterium]
MADTNNKPNLLAAVDLGSNSFHMIITRVDGSQLKTIDRLKESVRLGEGLDENKHLKPEVAERALACLSRFSQRIGALDELAVRAVGTNTLRRINDGGTFLRQAEKALGHRIDIISGLEEARLVYLGVAHGLAAGDPKRLVVDIGGGSTELIVGQQFTAKTMDSLYMGCVSITQRFFPDGEINKKRMDSAILACMMEIHPVISKYHSKNWQEAVGSSGTIKAVRDVLQAETESESSIQYKSLKRLKKLLIKKAHTDNLDLPGLSDQRKPVFAGGVAVLSAIFKALNIERMRVSDLALKEGVAYEMVGTIQQHDTREKTVELLASRYSLDIEQGQLVAQTAESLFDQIAIQWDLLDPDNRRLLGWAAKLCEIGLVIAHSGYHKHGAYILANGDMQGFSRREQAILATLVEGHRNKFPKTGVNELSKKDFELCQRLSVILRIAVLLHRGHSHAGKPAPSMAVNDNQIQLTFPDNWLDEHPLTQAELNEESRLLDNAGFKLDIH